MEEFFLGAAASVALDMLQGEDIDGRKAVGAGIIGAVVGELLDND